MDRYAIAAVLDQHRWKDMGIDWVTCECGARLESDNRLTTFPADEALRLHLADAILEAM